MKSVSFAASTTTKSPHKDQAEAPWSPSPQKSIDTIPGSPTAALGSSISSLSLLEASPVKDKMYATWYGGSDYDDDFTEPTAGETIDGSSSRSLGWDSNHLFVETEERPRRDPSLKKPTGAFLPPIPVIFEETCVSSSSMEDEAQEQERRERKKQQQAKDKKKESLLPSFEDAEKLIARSKRKDPIDMDLGRKEGTSLRERMRAFQ